MRLVCVHNKGMPCLVHKLNSDGPTEQLPSPPSCLLKLYNNIPIISDDDGGWRRKMKKARSPGPDCSGISCININCISHYYFRHHEGRMCVSPDAAAVALIIIVPTEVPLLLLLLLFLLLLLLGRTWWWWSRSFAWKCNYTLFIARGCYSTLCAPSSVATAATVYVKERECEKDLIRDVFLQLFVALNNWMATEEEGPQRCWHHSMQFLWLNIIIYLTLLLLHREREIKRAVQSGPSSTMDIINGG